MSEVFLPVKIVSVRNTERFVVVVFEDGQEFTYPSYVLHSAIPKNRSAARRVQESLLRAETKKTSFVH
jgi:hypothetical protein